MTIYQYRTTVSTAQGASSSTTLNIVGGLCRQVYVVANTSTTVFRLNIVDDGGVPLTVANYGFSTGMLNDLNIALPMAGRYTVNITNASPNDTFNILLGVEE